MIIISEAERTEVEEAKRALLAEKARVDSAVYPKILTNEDYLKDSEYRSAAVTYIEVIESVISRVDDERESVASGWPGGSLSGEEEMQLKDAAVEVDDLLNPLGATIYTVYGTYTGMHVLNQIRKRIQGYERMC